MSSIGASGAFFLTDSTVLNIFYQKNLLSFNKKPHKYLKNSCLKKFR